MNTNKPDIKIIKATDKTHIIEYKGVCLCVNTYADDHNSSSCPITHDFTREIDILVELVNKGLTPEIEYKKYGQHEVEIVNVYHGRKLVKYKEDLMRVDQSTASNQRWSPMGSASTQMSRVKSY